MKVLIDGHMLGTGEGGNERYIENLSLALLKDKTQTLKTQIIVPQEYYRKLGKTLKKDFIGQDFPSNIIRIFCTLPKVAKDLEADIIHATYVGPFFSRFKLVLMVHDLTFKRFPEFFTFREKIIFDYFLPVSMAKAAAIVVPSEFTKKELISFYPRHAKKVFVTQEASSPQFKVINKNKARSQIEKKYKIRSPFLLAFNGKHDKRNINRVIEAFEQIKYDFPNLQLVILGGKYHIKKKIDSKRIKILKNISDKDLAVLYNATEVVIYFSLYEGFGLPVLEAFSCKTPVIASDIPAIREVAGNAALYANPQSANDLAIKISKLIGNKELQKKMSVKGFNKASKYSWEKTAKETIKIYEFALKKQ